MLLFWFTPDEKLGRFAFCSKNKCAWNCFNKVIQSVRVCVFEHLFYFVCRPSPKRSLSIKKLSSNNVKLKFWYFYYEWVNEKYIKISEYPNVKQLYFSCILSSKNKQKNRLLHPCHYQVWFTSSNLFFFFKFVASKSKHRRRHICNSYSFQCVWYADSVKRTLETKWL